MKDFKEEATENSVGWEFSRACDTGPFDEKAGYGRRTECV
jgi:hypothetical protein